MRFEINGDSRGVWASVLRSVLGWQEGFQPSTYLPLTEFVVLPEYSSPE